MPVTFTVPNVFAGRTIANVSEIDGDFSAIQTALSGVALSSADVANISPTQQTWRNLHLRTHPDADKAPNQMAVLRLDEIVLDSGKRYTGLTLPLTADITVSGAGGLDTGTRAVSTWYEAHIIGKSDGNPANLRLIFHKALAYTLDQSQTAHASNQPLNSAATTNQLLGQKFTPGTTGSVPYVDVWVQMTGAVPAATQVWLELRTDNAGVPSSTVLATSDKLDASKFTTAGQIQVRFPFRSPASLTSATQYWIVVNTNYTTSGANFLNIGFNAAGTNQFFQFNGTTWSAIANATMAFRETVNVSTSLVYPTGFSDQGLIGWVFNNAGNTLDPIRFRDRRAHPLSTSLFVNAVTPTVALSFLVDLSAFVPPVPFSLLSDAQVAFTGGNLAIAGIPDGYLFTNAMSSLAGQSIVSEPTSNLAFGMQWIDSELQALYVASANAVAVNMIVNVWEW